MIENVDDVECLLVLPPAGPGLVKGDPGREEPELDSAVHNESPLVTAIER
jgi:hypothetical protein